MKLSIIEAIASPDMASTKDRDKFFSKLLNGKKNQMIKIHRDYYDGDHWQLPQSEGRVNTTKSGKMVWGTDLAGNYEPDSDQCLKFDLDLRSASNPWLSFSLWLNLTPYNLTSRLGSVSDLFTVEVKNDTCA